MEWLREPPHMKNLRESLPAKSISHRVEVETHAEPSSEPKVEYKYDPVIQSSFRAWYKKQYLWFGFHGDTNEKGNKIHS